MARSAADIAILMGSQSDWDTMLYTAETLDVLNVSYEARIISTHWTPDRMVAFARGTKTAGFSVIIADAGGGLLICRA